MNPNFKTGICKNFYNGCVYANKCNFAHSIDEIQPKKCLYDKKCVNERCTFFHTGEPCDKKSLWVSGMKMHFEYTTNECDTNPINIIKNNVVGFEPKTITDVENIMNGFNKHSLVITPDEDSVITDFKKMEVSDVYETMRNDEKNEPRVKIELPKTNKYQVELNCEPDVFLKITSYMRTLGVDYSLCSICK